MAVPKKKTSKAKGRKRRAHYKANAAALVNCENCGDKKRPHYVCPHCGFYRGKKIIATTE